MAIEDDVLLSWHDSIVELFELDLSPITSGVPDNKFYFTNQTTASGTKIRWKATGSGSALVTYEPLPILAEGFEKSTKGQIPQPTLTVANIFGTFTEAVGELDDLVGAKITRRRTLAKYLGDQPGQDLTAEFPPDVFYVERKTAETNQYITFELASPLDLEGLQLPRRVITQNYCLWKYRGAECGYSGPPVADVYDRPLTGDGASSEYVNALKAYEAARVSYNNAVAAYNVAAATASGACDPSVVSVAAQRFYYGTGQSDFGLTFAMLDGASVGLVMWNGQIIPESNTGYRVSNRTSNTVYDGASGPIYSIIYDDGLDRVEQYSLSRSSPSFVFVPEDGQPRGVWNGSLVNVIPEESFISPPAYIIGALRTSTGFPTMAFVDQLDFNNSGCSAATAAANAAAATLATATSTLNSTFAAYQAALNNLPPTSAVYDQDQCGKRLSSCKLRFGSGQLPFGGFPGANLVR